MAYATYTNDMLRNGQVRIAGRFVEKEYGKTFEYADRSNEKFPADFMPELPHMIFVGDGDSCRLAHVMKTVAYVQVNEDQTDKWQIKQRREY